MNIEKMQDNELNKIKRQVVDLQKENDDLQSELYLVNEKLRESEQLKGHFISNVSNEIVNPLSSILALSAGIKQMNADENQKIHEMAGLIFDEAFHLDFQLKNVFAAALIEAGKEEVQASIVDLSEMLEQINQFFAPLLRKKQISLLAACESGLAFKTDKDKLELIIKNLISNSIKFSLENSEIEVTFFKNEGWLNIEVSDQGKGVQAEDRITIFDRFKQLDEKINSINTGHGLGLSIVKSYVEMLGGEVNISDNGVKGIKVMIALPETESEENWDDLDGFIIDSEASY